MLSSVQRVTPWSHCYRIELLKALRNLARNHFPHSLSVNRHAMYFHILAQVRGHGNPNAANQLFLLTPNSKISKINKFSKLIELHLPPYYT